MANNQYQAFCKHCNLYLKARHFLISRHANTESHKCNVLRKTVAQRNISDFMRPPDRPFAERVAAAEIKICGYLSEHNVAFLGTNHLTHLVKEIFYDHPVAQELKLKRSKATKVTVNVIGASHKDVIAQKLQTRKFSVLTDESTDIATIKTSCVVVRFYDGDMKKVVSKFWDLSRVYDADNVEEGATADNLFKSIMSSFRKYSVPLENIIGFGSDGCNAMMGPNNSVSTRFRGACPGIMIMKCVCHSVHLCASEACKKLPDKCEGLARSIFNFFSHSSKRLCEFQQFQWFVDVKPLKLLHPSQTRWLSLIRVVERVLNQWSALQLYFSDQWLGKNVKSAEEIFNGLHDPFMKLYYYFLAWVLPKFTTFNEFFQSQEVVITDLHDKIRRLYEDLLLCFMNREHVMRTDLNQINPRSQDQTLFLTDRQLYLGVKVLQNIDRKEILDCPEKRSEFFAKCRSFLQVYIFISRILEMVKGFDISCKTYAFTFFQVGAEQVRFRYNMADPVLSRLNVFLPRNALSRAFRDDNPSLVPLINVVPRVVSSEKIIQNIDDQWRRLPYCLLPENIGKLEMEIEESSKNTAGNPGKKVALEPSTSAAAGPSGNDFVRKEKPAELSKKKKPTDGFWSQLLEHRGESGIQEFQELATFALDVLSLPHSNADCERIFSKVGVCKKRT